MSLYKKYSDLGAPEKDDPTLGNTTDIPRVQSIQHKQGLISHNRVVVIDIYADWCGPCKHVAPLFVKLAKKYSNECIFVKEDADDQFTPDCTGVPMFQIYMGGKIKDTIMGADLKKVEQSIVDAINGG